MESSPAEAQYLLVNREEAGDPKAGDEESCTERIKRLCALTLATVSILIGCGFPAADIFTDVFLALPAYLAHGLVESFEIQLFAIVLGALTGYVSINLWHKLSRLPKWQRAQLILGGVLTCPLTPVIVMLQAVVGWCIGDETLLKECKSAVFEVTKGELLESVMSAALTVKAMFVNAVDLKISLIAGICSATKGALAFDLRQSTRLSIIFTKGEGDSATDEEIPVVSGMMPDLTTYPGLTLLLTCHRFFELCSGLGCATMFHVAAYHIFSITLGTRTISLAAPIFISIQLATVAMAQFMNAASSSFFQLPLVPFCVPLPLLDSQVSSTVEYAVRFVSQIAVLLTCVWSNSGGRGFHVVDDNLWWVHTYITAATSIMLWASLAVLQAFRWSIDPEHTKKISEQVVNADRQKKNSRRQPTLRSEALEPPNGSGVVARTACVLARRRSRYRPAVCCCLLHQKDSDSAF